MCNRNLICPEYSLSSHAISGVLLLLEALYTVILLVVAGYVWRCMSSHVTTSILVITNNLRLASPHKPRIGKPILYGP
jgi:hypothetical protein